VYNLIQLQICSECLNYAADFFQDFRQICEPLYRRLGISPPAWSHEHALRVRKVKKKKTCQNSSMFMYN
jgi:hypothetical protein